MSICNLLDQPSNLGDVHRYAILVGARCQRFREVYLKYGHLRSLPLPLDLGFG